MVPGTGPNGISGQRRNGGRLHRRDGAHQDPGDGASLRVNIATVHKALRETNPLDSAAVRFALQRMHRRRGRRQAQVQGLTWPLRNRLIEATGDRLIDARNRALLAVGYDTLLRRAELVSVKVADLLEEIDGTATLSTVVEN